MDPKYVKAYYRRGSANLLIGGKAHMLKALKDFKTVAKAHPKDPDARRKLAECDKQVRPPARAHLSRPSLSPRMPYCAC